MGMHNETNKIPTKIICRHWKCQSNIWAICYQMFDHFTLFQFPWDWEVFGKINSTTGSPSLKEIHRPLFNIRLSVKNIAKFWQKQNCHLIQVHIFRNQIWLHCVAMVILISIKYTAPKTLVYSKHERGYQPPALCFWHCELCLKLESVTIEKSNRATLTQFLAVESKGLYIC